MEEYQAILMPFILSPASPPAPPPKKYTENRKTKRKKAVAINTVSAINTDRGEACPKKTTAKKYRLLIYSIYEISINTAWVGYLKYISFTLKYTEQN
jgi:hypothetical protein